MYQVLSITYKIFKKYLFIILVIPSTCCILLNTSSPAHAQTMSNENYIIEMQDFNAISNVSGDQDYKLRSTTGGLNPAISEGVNFKVTSGFENLPSAFPFTISLSSDIADFGNLSPTNPVIRTVDIDVQNLSAYGYSVFVFEDQPLTTTLPNSKAFIPDTTCDNGNCGNENSDEWTNALTYGFGYRCDNIIGADCDNSFVKTNYYKHFPNLAGNDEPQAIMAGIDSNNQKTRISYKVNISGTQAKVNYSNTITYIGIPNF